MITLADAKASTDKVTVRLTSRLIEADGHWMWTGRVDNTYGRLAGPSSRLEYAHRLAYTLWTGPIPDGLQIDHLCRVRLCCNPAHLEAVTQQVNLARGQGMCVINAAKTHCPQGHPYSPENTRVRYRKVAERCCRTCDRERNSRRKTSAA